MMLGATAAGSMLLTGCANITSGGPVAPLQEKPDEICIIKNPKVTYRDAVPYLQRAFKLRGIATHVVDTPQQCKKTCPWKLRYSMRRSWDWSTYLGTVNLRLHKDGHLVSQADYEAGYYSFSKWGSSDSRIDGVVGSLLGIN